MDTVNAKTAAVTSVGCKVSQYDARRAEEELADAGFTVVPFSSSAGVYVINTCSVTNIADKKSRSVIRRALKRNPEAVVVACGCYSELEPEEVKALGVHIVLGAEGYKHIAAALEEYFGAVSGAVLPSTAVDGVRIASAEFHAPRTRAHLKIQDGCDKFCSYCVIPYARGRSVSRPPGEIIREAELLAESGVKEIVITGIHVASYGKDLEKAEQGAVHSLLNICRAVSGIGGIERIRLSSLSPMAVTERFAEEIAALPVCPHFHLSLQSGSAKVLRDMNRGYTPEDYARAVSLLKRAFPGCAVWSDIIAGFPGETELDFEESLAFIAKSGIVKLHIFPFSPKKGTRAFALPQVDGQTKAARVKALEEFDTRLYTDYLSANTGSVKRVLYEMRDGEYLTGHTENYILIRVPSKRGINEAADVRIERFSRTGGGFEVFGAEYQPAPPVSANGVSK